MPAAANADPASNIFSTSADLNGTIAGTDPGDQYQFSFGTTPGGPYPTFPILQPTPSPAADGPVTVNTGNQLSPNTTYYYVITTYDSLNNVIAVSNEQSFTTLSVQIDCDFPGPSGPFGETSAVLQWTAQGNTNTNWHYTLKWGTTPGGPYPNEFTPHTFADGTDPDGQVQVFGPGVFPAGTQIYYTWELYDDTGGVDVPSNVLQDTSSECTFNTVVAYSVSCDPATNITQTSADLNGTGTDVSSTVPLRFAWGTTPGGPYPNTTAFDPGDGPGAQPMTPVNIAGLTPNTQYYYVVQSMIGTNDVEKQSSECSFTTLPVGPPARTASGDPATNVTQTTADLNGTLGGIQPGDTVEFLVGPSGGPYSTVIGPNPAANGPNSAPIGGLTPGTQYCYLVQVRDNTTAIVATSPTEVCFTTPSVVTFSPECNPAVLQSAKSANLQGTVDNMDALHKARIEVATAPGGPYTFAQSGDTFGNNTVNQNIPGVPFLVSGLTLGTTYYYRVAVYDNGNVFVEASTECSFTTPNPSIICGTVTNITDTTADFNATALESDSPPGYIYIVEVATVSGGPYTALPGATNNDGTDPDAFTASKAGMLPNTTYFYRYLIFDNQNNLVFTSPECGQFTTEPQDSQAVCAGATAITDTSATLNGTLTGVSPGDTYEFAYGTTPGGPYGTTIGPFAAANGPVSQPAPGLTPSTTYYFVVITRDAGAAIEDTSSECSFATAAPPVTVTTDPGGPSTASCVTLNGTSTNAQAANCTYSFIWGTTPGGPYPNVVNGSPFVATGASPEAFTAQVCGLNPGQTIYYKARVQCGANPPIIGDEVQTTTTSIIVDPCEPATNITAVSATIAASATGVPAGYSLRFRYGYTPGGPYTNTVPGTPAIATGADPIAWTANLAGLTAGATVYYISEVLNPAQQVVADGGECSFQLTQATGPDGFISWCGAWYDSGQCIFVPFNEGDYYGDSDGNAAGYYNCSFVDSIDDV